MQNLYPNIFMYKIIFKATSFDQGHFFSKLEEKCFKDSNTVYSIKESSGGKYLSYTINFFLEDEKRADLLNELIYSTEGIINYYTVALREGNGGIK